MTGEDRDLNVSLKICPGWCNNAKWTEVLEEYRRYYESLHGPTDLSQTYCTQLPPFEQNAIMLESMDKYVAGMPPYLRSFLQWSVKERDAPLDDDSVACIELSMALLRYGRPKGRGRSR
jgi:hypothetical protein